jgi:hypothetical protein
MKRTLLLLLTACGVSVDLPADSDLELQTEAQVALTEVTQALITGDRERFEANYMRQDGDPENMAQILFDTQREGLMTQHNGETPRVIDVRAEDERTVSMAIFSTVFNRPSPKRVWYRRDTEGKLRWIGIPPGQSSPSTPPENGIGVKRQAVYNPSNYNYDVWNQSGTQLHTLHSEERTSEGVQCFTGTNICYAITGPNPVGAGVSGNTNRGCNAIGTQCALAFISPANTTCGCSTHTSLAPDYCCWVHAHGWDFWWNTDTDGVIAAAPYCGAPGYCP